MTKEKGYKLVPISITDDSTSIDLTPMPSRGILIETDEGSGYIPKDKIEEVIQYLQGVNDFFRTI